MSVKRIYLAAPFFNAYELSCVRRAEEILTARGFELFSPRLHEVRDPAEDQALWSRETFCSDRRFIDWADLVVMLYHGAYSDSGTAWEAGYACGTGKPVVAVHVGSDPEAGSNLMVHLYRSGVLPAIAFLTIVLAIRYGYGVYKRTLA